MSFLIAPTATASMPYALGTGFALNMLAGSRLSTSGKVAAAQVVAFAASAAFAALAATYGAATIMGVTAGVGFVSGLVVSVMAKGKLSIKGSKTGEKLPVSHAQAAVMGAIIAVGGAAVLVFGGRVVNNGLGAAGKFVCTPLQPYVDFARAKAGY